MTTIQDYAYRIKRTQDYFVKLKYHWRSENKTNTSKVLIYPELFSQLLWEYYAQYFVKLHFNWIRDLLYIRSIIS